MLLGPGSRAHLQSYAAAGFAGFLFSPGASGNTCACDAKHDGVTKNPPPIDGNTMRSYSADDDGGYLKHQAHVYYDAVPINLPG